MFCAVVLVTMTLTELTLMEAKLGLNGRTLNAVLAKQGDINIGQLADITLYNSVSETCGPALNLFACEAIEMAIYAIDKINKRTDLLPNITIGMVILDTCSKDTKTLEVVTYFDPHPECPENSNQYPNETVNGFTDILRNYRVVAIVGPRWSKIATAVVSLMGVFEIPLIGTTTTSDALSDKSRFEYFMRVTAPDRYITATIAKVLKYFGWSYVSVVYNFGSYGENAYQQLSNFLTEDVCIAVARVIPADATDGTYANIVDDLINNDKAKVIAVFVDDVMRARTLFRAMRSRRRVGTFVWIGGDTMASYEYEPTMENMLEGSMAVTHPSVPIQDFVDYLLEGVTPQVSEGNRWILNVWEQYYNCSFPHRRGIQNSAGNICSMNLTMNSAICPNDPVQHDRIHDAYMVYSQALHAYIADNCPEGFQQKQILMDCIKGDRLLRLLHDSTFEGVLGRIKFDANGDMLENLVVRQFYTPGSNSTNAASRMIGLWNATEDRLYINDTLVNWRVFQNSSSLNDTNVKPLASSCSSPCLIKEYLTRESSRTCCWTCAQCRDNEIIVLNRSGCQVCPKFFWPDEVTASQCLEIPADYLRLENFHSVLLVCLLTLSAAVVIACGIEYIRRRHHVLMADFSLHLRFISLAGMMLGSVTILLLLLHPTAFWHLCSVRGACYHLSVCLIYVPQLIRIVQIYRVFMFRRTQVQHPLRASVKMECSAVAILVSVQVILLAATESSFTSGATLEMQNVYTRYVEVYCLRSNFSFLVPLSYNAVVLFAIATVAFMSRKFPLLFDEAWLMFASVSATSFCWVIIMPTYFTVNPLHIQAAILGYALVLNCLVTVIVQYLPVLYALVTAAGTDDQRIDKGEVSATVFGRSVAKALWRSSAAAAASNSSKPK